MPTNDDSGVIVTVVANGAFRLYSEVGTSGFPVGSLYNNVLTSEVGAGNDVTHELTEFQFYCWLVTFFRLTALVN